MPRARNLRPRTLALAILFALLAAAALFVYSAATAQPGAARDYSAELAEIIRRHDRADPYAPNAWPHVEQAILLFRAALDALNESRPGPRRATGAEFAALYSEADEWPDRSRYVEEHRKAAWLLDHLRTAGLFETLARVAASERLDPPLLTGPIAAWFRMDLAAFRSLGRLCAARMHLACAGPGAVDEDELVDAYAQLLALARAVAAPPFVLHHLVGVALAMMAHDRLNDCLTRDPLSEDAVLRLISALEAHRLPPFAACIDADRLVFREMGDTMYSAGGRLVPSAAREVLGAVWAPKPAGALDRARETFDSFFLATRREAIAKHDEYAAGLAALALIPRAGRTPDMFDPDAFAQSLPPRHRHVAMLTPVLSRCLASRDEHDLRAAGMRIVLAIELHRARTGRYPGSLDELPAPERAALPRDPWSGRPWGYRRHSPTTPGDHRRYIVYSVGADAADDGGAPHPKHNSHALKEDAFPADYLINDRRPPD